MMANFTQYDSCASEPLCRPRIGKAKQSLDMKHETGKLGMVLGGIVALVAILFIFSGGSLGGKTTVEGDQDLPPIANSDE
jgi:hypothetical protein